MSRIDDLNVLYRPSASLHTIEKILFVLDIAAALISLSSDYVVSTAAITFQIIVALFYFLCNTVDDGYIWYEAEKERRKHCVQNGLGVRLSEFETDGYYNNTYLPSIEKYGLNILESNFFSKEIAGRMILKNTIYPLAAMFSLIITVRYTGNVYIILIVVQTVFSSYVLVDFLMLLMYRIKMRALYDEAYNNLVLCNYARNNSAWLISYIIEYEAIKAHYKIRLDENVFKRHNAVLSQKWQTILSHRPNNADAR